MRFAEETVWLRQDEIAKLYGKERSVVTRHINKIFTDKEIDKKSNVQKMHIANSDKPVTFYNLDVILAVGSFFDFGKDHTKMLNKQKRKCVPITIEEIRSKLK